MGAERSNFETSLQEKLTVKLSSTLTPTQVEII